MAPTPPSTSDSRTTPGASDPASTPWDSSCGPSTWVLKLPWQLPPLSLNRRINRHVKARITKEIREAAFLLAKHHKVTKGCSRIRVTLIYRPMDNRRRDAINLVPVLKAVEDGLVDARIVPDDTPVYIDPVMPQIHERVDGQKKGELLVLIERLA